jgi:hypothetical protein
MKFDSILCIIALEETLAGIGDLVPMRLELRRADEID